jgi:diaminohydroxyphosphoribosylaminopyrimidine deaminase/5-amino-6-(5-phosphoribosylamino)uracil reductase
MNVDREYMKRALTLAKKGLGRTSPNPAVGAVIVKNGKIIGEGYHKKAGTSHAEVNAIASAVESTEGSTIYVTLEPCSTTGKTPPCTDAIITAKFAKVVIATLDPNPNHAGRGVEILNNAGIETIVGLEKSKCIEINKAFFHWIQTKTPYVILKMAMTLDGKIATANGNSKWITGPDARKNVQKLRKWSDAIMVGGGTVRADSPSLNVRNSQGNPIKNWKQPHRIVASRTMTPEDAGKLMGPGCQPVIISPDSPNEWRKVMKNFGENNITALLIEGGSELAASVIKAGIVNEIAFYIAPKILGGKNSIPVIGGKDPFSLDEALNLQNSKIRKIGDDFLITGELTKG